MDLNKNQVMAMMSCGINDSFQITASSSDGSLYVSNPKTNSVDYSLGSKVEAFYRPTTPWEYWRDYYYPTIIRESYPVYIQEKAVDKGKQAFEIIKALKDKGLLKLPKVEDFIEAMDTLLKTL